MPLDSKSRDLIAQSQLPARSMSLRRAPTGPWAALLRARERSLRLCIGEKWGAAARLSASRFFLPIFLAPGPLLRKKTGHRLFLSRLKLQANILYGRLASL